MSQPWPEIELGDVVQKIVGGGTPARGNPDFWEGDIPWATVKDMKEGVFKLSDTQESITELGLSKSASNLIPAGTVITSTRMGLGRCFIPTRSVAINQDLKALFPNESIDSQYLLWLLVSRAGEIQSMGTGTTVSGVRLEQLRALRFPLPPLPTQRKIAAILSAYDDLIENNTRRVRVLEQMARALYREWFVEYRYPGHEQAQWVEDEAGRRPQGWEWVTVGELASVNSRSIKKGKVPAEVLYVDLSSVGTGVIEKAELSPFEEAPGRARRLAQHGDTIWATVRPNRRSFALVLNPDPRLVVSTGFAVLSPKAIPFTYLYQATTTEEFSAYLVGRARGAAYPAVVAVDFEEAPLLLPDSKTLSLFHERTEALMLQQENLRQRNANLRRTRDLLLPRLVSGELDVSGLRVAGVEEEGEGGEE